MTVLDQDIGDGWCVRTSVTLPGSWGGFLVVGRCRRSGCRGGSGVLGEVLAEQVGDGDLVAGLIAVGDDEYLFEGMVDVDLVGHLVQPDGAGGADRSDACVGGMIGRWPRSGTPDGDRRLVDGPVRPRSGRIGLGGHLPGGQWRDAPRRSLVGSLGVVEVVERVDLGLELGRCVGQRLLVEVAEQGLVEAFVLAASRPSAASSSAAGEPRRPRGRPAPTTPSKAPLLAPSRASFSCTLIGPWSSPETSSAARTCIACSLTSSVSFDGLDLGRRVRGSSTAAGPSAFARLRSS